MKHEESSPAEKSDSEAASGNRKGRGRRLLRRGLVGLLALAVVYLAAYLWSLRMLHRAEARVAAAGGSLAFAEFVPPELAAGEANASDLLEAAVKLVDEQRPWDELRTTWRALDQRQADLTPESLDLFRRWVDKSRPVLSLLDQARPIESARYDTEYLDVVPFEITIPNLLARLQMSDLLRARALVAMDDGRPEDAYRDVVAAYRLGNWCRREMPTVLISNLVAVAVSRRTSRLTNRLLQATPPSAEQKAEIVAEARQLDPYEALNVPLHGERVACHRSLVLRRPSTAGLITAFAPESSWRRLAIYPEVGLPPLRIMNAAAYVDAMTTAIELCEPPSYQQEENLEERFDELIGLPGWMVLARILMINCATVAQKRDAAVVQLDLMELAFQLDDHRTATGQYPETLDPLPGGAFVDPFSGQPYRYRRAGDGYVLYSVSGNRRDDQGAFPPLGEDGRSLDLNEGDIVWTME